MTPTDKPSQGTPHIHSNKCYIEGCDKDGVTPRGIGSWDEAAQQPTASEPTRKQRRCEICQSHGHVTLDHGAARGYSHSVVPAASEQWRAEGYVCAALHRVPIAGCHDCIVANEQEMGGVSDASKTT